MGMPIVVYLGALVLAMDGMDDRPTSIAKLSR